MRPSRRAVRFARDGCFTNVNNHLPRRNKTADANNSFCLETINVDAVSPVAGDQSGDETELYTFDRYSLTSDYTSTRDWHDANDGLLHEDAFGSVSETVDANGQIASTWEDDVTVTDSGGNWIEGTNPTETELYDPDHAGRAFGYNNATSYLTGLGTTVALSGLVNQVANAEGEGSDGEDGSEPDSPGSDGNRPIPLEPIDAPPTEEQILLRAWFVECVCGGAGEHSTDSPTNYEDGDPNADHHGQVPEVQDEVGVPPCGPRSRNEFFYTVRKNRRHPRAFKNFSRDRDTGVYFNVDGKPYELSEEQIERWENLTNRCSFIAFWGSILPATIETVEEFSSEITDEARLYRSHYKQYFSNSFSGNPADELQYRHSIALAQRQEDFLEGVETVGNATDIIGAAGLARRAALCAVKNAPRRCLTRGSGHGYANNVLDGGTGRSLAGHGELRLGSGSATIPEGTTLT